ncbi:MAG: hypothetical protein ACQEQL_00860 [Pseudomonadota bacterium]
MLIQILRTVLIGAAIYFLGKLLKHFIDRVLEPKTEIENEPTSEEDTAAPAREKLIPCPKCGVYYNADNPKACSLKNCPVADL